MVCMSLLILQNGLLSILVLVVVSMFGVLSYHCLQRFGMFAKWIPNEARVWKYTRASMNPFCKHEIGTKFAEHGAKWRHAMPNRLAKLGKGSRISKRNTMFCRCGANLAQRSNSLAKCRQSVPTGCQVFTNITKQSFRNLEIL